MLDKLLIVLIIQPMKMKITFLISTVILSLTAGCSSFSKTEIIPSVEKNSVIETNEVILRNAYYVIESPMPYGLKGESIHVLETSASEANGVYRRAGSRPYVIISQRHKEISHVQRPWAVYFNFNSAEITGTQIGSVQDMVSFLNRNPSRKISIVGYTDSYGSREINDNLAKQRAVNVRSFLLKNGLKNGRQIIRLDVAPQSHYLVSNDFGKQLAARNRRVEVILLE